MSPGGPGPLIRACIASRFCASSGRWVPRSSRGHMHQQPLMERAVAKSSARASQCAPVAGRISMGLARVMRGSLHFVTFGGRERRNIGTPRERHMHNLIRTLSIVAAGLALSACGISRDLRYHEGFADFGSPGMGQTDRELALSLGPLPLKIARALTRHAPPPP